MQPIQTLTDFLSNANVSFRLFDMGRRVSKLSTEEFRRFEQAQTPYPLPFLQQAWIGVLLWSPKQKQQQIIWFLKLPLDEQGLLVQAARDDFLHRLARCVGDQLLEQNEGEDPLKDNPFAFTPDQEKMAAFHAKAAQILHQPHSVFYQPTRDYLAGLKDLNDWQQLGLQGIADVCDRLDQQNNAELLERILDQLPLPPLEAFCAQLEHQQPPHSLSRALSRRLHRELETGSCEATSIGALLRALSQSFDAQQRQQAIQAVLTTPYGTDVEVLAAIASRCWADLQQAELCQAFLEALARNPAGQPCFNRVLADLVFIPGMRPAVMAGLRNPERSDQLAQAIGGFFGQVR
ncbi:DUF3549 family protein [Motiliproteus coralliicola]|uniref:DUF3549 family protein n=1 Tax=Motiliproteus coralliicola TaxID=2283196 RepID=A0A369WTH2_9GAMM|nr:DUF3549 family protein [Motiliproteus coralliicola]RDE24992.1 DUF3549 family protein [Motiliproteus coralliicola]